MNYTEHANRRTQLIAKIGKGNIAIIPSANVQYRNADTEYRFRQNSDFLYLTGFSEPNACLVLCPEHPDGESWLFCQPSDPEKERWDGPRLGLEQARKQLLVDQTFASKALAAHWPTLSAKVKKLWAPAELPPHINDLLGDEQDHQDLSELLHPMRLIKSSTEIAHMRRAIAISTAGHLSCMQHCRPGLKETEMLCHFMQPMLAAGCLEFAYPPIIASGDNACTLHYIDLKDTLQDQGLVLLDIGVEYEGYAADITRTYPINGKFSSAQQAIYQAVLDTQSALIEAIKPGITWQALQTLAIEQTTSALCGLGILVGDVAELIEQGAYKPFFMHGFGHWLGLDVHDISADREAPLAPGMVLTVEPGVYIDPQQPDIDQKWLGIGVRIEDNVLVTDTGCEVLSAAAPKTIEQLEQLIGSKQ